MLKQVWFFWPTLYFWRKESCVDSGVGYILRWFTCLQTVTCPSKNHDSDSVGSWTLDFFIISPTVQHPTVTPQVSKTQWGKELFCAFVVQIAVQLSVLVGKIARLDCPRNWPQLIPVLLDAVQVSDLLCQQRALQTLYAVVKSLASRRLPADRKVFEDVCIWSHCDLVFCLISVSDLIDDNIFDMLFVSFRVVKTVHSVDHQQKDRLTG